MNKEVSVFVTGRKDNEEIKTASIGTLYEKDNFTFVSYEEKSDKETVTKCLLKFNEKTVEMARKGSFSVKFVFEEGKENHSSYATPYGALAMDVCTKSLKVSGNVAATSIDIVYDITVNKGEKEENRILIEIK